MSICVKQKEFVLQVSQYLIGNLIAHEIGGNKTSLILTGLMISAGAFAIWAASDPEFVVQIKEVIYALVKVGYNQDKILYIMRIYV